MGLFSIFYCGKDSELLQDMKDCLSKFMAKYAFENPDDMPNVAGIFANAQMMLNSMTPKEVRKGLQKNGVAAECAVLNILQNCAMAEIESVPMKVWLCDGESGGGAFALYMTVNEEKLNLGYISVEQYEDNKRLGKCLRMGQRPII